MHMMYIIDEVELFHLALSIHQHLSKGIVSQLIHLQLTVVCLLLHGVDLWRATLPQQRVQWCSTAVTQVWFQKEG